MSFTWDAFGAMCVAFAVSVASSIALVTWICDRLRFDPEVLFDDEDGLLGFAFSPFALISSALGALTVSVALRLHPIPSMGWERYYILSLGVVALVTVLTRVYMPVAYAKYDNFGRYMRGEVHRQGLGGRIMQRVVFDREFFYHVFLPLELFYLVVIMNAWHGPAFLSWATSLGVLGLFGLLVVAVVFFLVGEGVFLLLLSLSHRSPSDEW
ncbi:MAG: hypothetical protein IT290_04620 [Deltaproteobacteria bacterium]|nr:hypothetical protein [Deltaproteobacteria bacterium]